METIKPDTNHQSSDPIDLAKLRYSQDYGNAVGVKKKITTVPVRNPFPQTFIRVHTGIDFQFETFLLDFKEDRETYLVDRPLWEFLPSDLVPKVLFTALTRSDDIFLWPVRLAGPDGKLSSWAQSAFTAVQLAKQSWIRVSANMKLGAYDVFQASANLPDPEWPDITMNELIQTAFKNRFITSLDHLVIKKLKGEQ